MREIHGVKKKTCEFHDNESEIISGESELLCRCGTIYNVQSILMSLSPHRGCGAYSRAALIRVNTVTRLFSNHYTIPIVRQFWF